MRLWCPIHDTINQGESEGGDLLGLSSSLYRQAEIRGQRRKDRKIQKKIRQQKISGALGELMEMQSSKCY